jgi:hypothetical protein
MNNSSCDAGHQEEIRVLEERIAVNQHTLMMNEEKIKRIVYESVNVRKRIKHMKSRLNILINKEK